MRWNSAFTLRDYQKRFCRSITDAFTIGVEGEGPLKRVLGVAGTGAGKTIMAAALTFAELTKGQRTLFLADRDKLVSQAASKIHETTGVIPDLEQGQSRAELDSDVVVASVQTISNPDRLARWAPDTFDLVIADEAHLSMAANWQRVLKHFDARILGITATPARADKKDLLKFYQTIAANIGLFELIEKGALVPIQVRTVGIHIDATQVKVSGADDNEEMAEAIEPYYDAVLDAWLEHARTRSTLVFMPSIAASKRFVERAQMKGIAAAHVDGTTKNQKQILEAFHDGKVQMLVNSNLLTTGYDEPRISCILSLRPTFSKTLYQQMIGRGTRLWPPTKENLLILDFLWQFAELGVMRPADLIAEAPEQREAVQRALETGKQLDLLEVDADVTTEREQALIRSLKRNVKKGGRVYDAKMIAAMCHLPEVIDYEPMAGWELKEPTEKQTSFLTKQGIDPDSVNTRGLASKIMTGMISRFESDKATIKQVAFLSARGVPNAASLTFKEASEAITLRTRSWTRSN